MVEEYLCFRPLLYVGPVHVFTDITYRLILVLYTLALVLLYIIMF